MQDGDNFFNLKHYDTIVASLSAMHQSWMSDDDKKEFNHVMVERFGMGLDAAIEDGINKGYKIDFQRELMSALIRRLS